MAGSSCTVRTLDSGAPGPVGLAGNGGRVRGPGGARKQLEHLETKGLVAEIMRRPEAKETAAAHKAKPYTLPKGSRTLGRCIWYCETKGYGFLWFYDRSGRIRDIFVHVTQLHCLGRRVLHREQLVEFTVTAGRRSRFCAVAVTSPGGAPLDIVSGHPSTPGRPTIQVPRLALSHMHKTPDSDLGTCSIQVHGTRDHTARASPTLSIRIAPRTTIGAGAGSGEGKSPATLEAQRSAPPSSALAAAATKAVPQNREALAPIVSASWYPVPWTREHTFPVGPFLPGPAPPGLHGGPLVVHWYPQVLVPPPWAQHLSNGVLVAQTGSSAAKPAKCPL